MNGEHPWLDWLRVLVIFVGGLIVVMILVRLLIKWAQKDDGLDLKADLISTLNDRFRAEIAEVQIDR